MRILVFFYCILLSTYASSFECNKELIFKEIKQSKNFIYGIGQSFSDNPIKGKEEAKARSYQDLISQLSVDVKTESTLSETESSTTLNSQTTINSKLDLLTDVKWEIENNTIENFCYVSSFDVKSSYIKAEGELKIILNDTKPILDAKRNKDYIEVIRLYSKVKFTLTDNADLVLKADAFKDYLKIKGVSYSEKFKKIESDINSALDDSKKAIVFFIDYSTKYEAQAQELESLLSSHGYKVQLKGTKPKNGIIVEIKEITSPRQTTTALGYTISYKFSVIIKNIETNQVLGATKDTMVQGISLNKNYEEAMESAGKQMNLIIDDLIKESIPGTVY